MIRKVAVKFLFTLSKENRNSILSCNYITCTNGFDWIRFRLRNNILILQFSISPVIQWTWKFVPLPCFSLLARLLRTQLNRVSFHEEIHGRGIGIGLWTEEWGHSHEFQNERRSDFLCEMWIFIPLLSLTPFSCELIVLFIDK